MTRAPAEARVRIGLRWRDMDMLGHLNQAVYHELLEEARGAAMGFAGAGSGEFGGARAPRPLSPAERRALGAVD